MRERLIDELGELPYRRFLVYLMGPYQAFDVEAVLDGTDGSGSFDPDGASADVDFGQFVGADVALDRNEAVLDLLLDVRDRLRTDPGVNAFLAIDVDVPLEEMDAASQSVEFALASNAVVYVVPAIGDNLGVGIEVGSVLEAISRRRTEGPDDGSREERVLFVHESAVQSALIGSVRDRWDARVYAYDDRAELVDRVRLFVRDVARRELRGDLPQLDAEMDRS